MENKTGTGRRSMSVEETKLGVTLVISKAECESLGISSKLFTGEAIRMIRAMLGLKNKK